MKMTSRILALLLAITLLAGMSVTASAADSIAYQEAVDLLSNLKINGKSILDPIGGADLDGKAKQALTKNEGIALINAFQLEGRVWEPVSDDKEITGEEFFQLVDRLLCTEGFYSDCRYVNAHINQYLTGLGDYETFAGKIITREEAAQVLMNAMDAKVMFGDTWQFRLEFDLAREISTDDSKTDEWKRPVCRWLQNGKAVTGWHTMSASYAGQANITTHDLLQLLGYYEEVNNQWLNFHCYSNAGQRWDCGKLHWNHNDGSGCHKNWISNRVGSKMEVYYLGIGTENIPDAGGDVSCQMYHVVFIDDYLAKIENQTISIYSNESGAIWSWHDDGLPKTDGWYIIRINLKAGDDKARAIVVQAAASKRAVHSGMEIPSYDGYNYVFFGDQKVLMSSKCQMGFEIMNTVNYKDGAKCIYFYDTWGNVIGAMDSEGFVDIPSNAWYKDAVDFVETKGLMTGTSATTFGPEQATTRAMIWTILARMDGVDTTGAVWYAAGQKWAMENGVSDGTDPNGKITREQLVTMLWRNAGEPASETDLSAFGDADKVSDWAVDAMRWAVEQGIIQGSKGNLEPQNSATRCQVAAILMRYCAE